MLRTSSPPGFNTRFLSSLRAQAKQSIDPARRLPRTLIECLAQRDVALLLLTPVAAAGNGAVDDEIVPVDEGGFVAGEEYRGEGDVIRQPGARDRLRGLVDLAHHVGGFLSGLDRQAERLAENAGRDR